MYITWETILNHSNKTVGSPRRLSSSIKCAPGGEQIQYDPGPPLFTHLHTYISTRITVFIFKFKLFVLYTW